MARKGITLDPNSELYDAIVMEIMDNKGYDDDGDVDDSEVYEYVTGILWNALESRGC